MYRALIIVGASFIFVGLLWSFFPRNEFVPEIGIQLQETLSRESDSAICQFEVVNRSAEKIRIVSTTFC